MLMKCGEKYIFCVTTPFPGVGARGKGQAEGAPGRGYREKIGGGGGGVGVLLGPAPLSNWPRCETRHSCGVTGWLEPIPA
ncbi:hypothetical protein SKAU_G00035780 [Synaphobranchus kaupii]|uniref:Uncharacterized protein n=1 Tax=Synaphobranchus kaupii TaxID=118154 RepID=A0A9Q1JFV9_SYNKA|nr:hypothetical protein SKAU_G00035780 [Synaphobranchus kaupii]